MIKTVTVSGVDFAVDFDGEPFVPAKVTGSPDTSYPCEGGEATINMVLLEGWDVTDLLSDWTNEQIRQQLVEYLCSSPEEVNT